MATFTRTAAQIEEIHNTVSDPSTNQAFTDAIGEQVIPKYTGIVYKASGGNSAVDNMVLGIPLTIGVGETCQCENGTIFLRKGNSTGSLDDYEAVSKVKAIDFGASTSSTDNYQSIQDAINHIETTGGFVSLPRGEFLVSATIVLPSAVIIQGEGHAATTIKLADNSNVAVIKSKGFDSLTGTGAWFVDTENVPYAMGIDGLTIDGNKSNQSSGNGVRLYAKRWSMNDVLILNSPGVGFYSECGFKPGQHDWRDMPEAKSGSLWVRGSESHGIQLRGPHDFHLGSLISLLNGGTGIRFETDGSTYIGSGDVDFIHSYANNVGFYAETGVNIGLLIGESNTEQGVVFASGATRSQVSKIYAYNNDSNLTGSHPDIQLDASELLIGSLRVRPLGASSSNESVRISGNGNQISSLNAFGNNSSALGLNVIGNENFIGSSLISDYSASGGVGLKTGQTASQGNNITSKIRNCGTCWQNVNPGVSNQYNLNITAAGNTQKIILPTSAGAGSDETWSILGKDSDNSINYYSEQKGIATISPSSSQVTVPHNSIYKLLSGVDTSGIHLSITPLGSITPAQQFWVGGISDDDFKINTGAGVASSVNFKWKIEI